MKKVLLGLFVYLSPTVHAQEAIDCTRVDNLRLDFLKGATSATVFKRRPDSYFDSRIRFYDKSGKQVESCSTDLGREGVFNCFQSSGLEGKDDEVVMILRVETESEASSLGEIEGEFVLRATGNGYSQSLKFVCGR